MTSRKKGKLDIRREIRRVIGLEEKALQRVGRAVDASYEKAVRWMLECRGKVVLTGVGKSGLIAQKIAATLSSTGTPAGQVWEQFVQRRHRSRTSRNRLVTGSSPSRRTARIRSILARARWV